MQEVVALTHQYINDMKAVAVFYFYTRDGQVVL